MKSSVNRITLLSLSALTAAVATVSHSARAMPEESQSVAAATQEVEWNYGDLGREDVPLSISNSMQGLDYRVSSKSAVEEHSRKRVQIVVHKSMKERGYQYLSVSIDGSVQFEAPVSTAWERLAPAKTGGAYRASTPAGTFHPDSIEPKRFSNRWQVWLTNVIRFNSGIWIHSTTPDHYAELGAPASGGCVRMHPNDSKVVWDIIAKYGLKETAITVQSHESDEPQLPWKLQPKRQIPADVQAWRVTHKIK